MSEAESALRSKSLDAGVVDNDARLDFYARAEACDLAPLWRKLAGLVTPEPKPKAVPFMWKFNEVRRFLMEATDLVTAEEAERRVMVLENPGLKGQSRISDSLFAGLQIILPGEDAPAHRHVASALRLILEGSDAYTAVNGERTIMHVGDFITTPNWTWHDHANFGSEPMIWLDGLDMHIVNLFTASFREEMEHVRHEIARPDDSSQAEFGYGMAPAGFTPQMKSSPVLNYPYARAKAALDSLRSHAEPDPCRGHVLNYLNPMTGGWALPTIATSMRALPRGFATRPYRSTDATIFVVLEGEGQSRIGDTAMNWSERDVFVAPSWARQEHVASRDAVIFSYSDRAVQEKLDLWREDRTLSDHA